MFDGIICSVGKVLTLENLQPAIATATYVTRSSTGLLLRWWWTTVVPILSESTLLLYEPGPNGRCWRGVSIPTGWNRCLFLTISIHAAAASVRRRRVVVVIIIIVVIHVRIVGGSVGSIGVDFPAIVLRSTAVFLAEEVLHVTVMIWIG